MALAQGVKREDARRSVQAQKLPRWVIARTEPPAPPTPTLTAEWPAERAVEHERPSAPMSLLAEHVCASESPLGLGARAHDRCCPRGLAGPDRRPARRAATAVAAASSTDCSRSTRSSKCLRSCGCARVGSASRARSLRSPSTSGSSRSRPGTSTSRRCRQADGGSSPPRRVASRTEATVNGVERHWSTRALSRDVQPHPAS